MYEKIPKSAVELMKFCRAGVQPIINMGRRSGEPRKCHCGNPVDTSDPSLDFYNLCKDCSQDV